MDNVLKGMHWQIIILVTLFAVLGIKGRAQEKYLFEHITTLNGLPENYINCIHQDADGFLWLGTHDGLCRYDGSQFEVFSLDRKKTNWIRSILIRHISEDNDRNLWILTTDLGIYRYDLDRNYFQYLGMPGILSDLQPSELLLTRRIGNDLLVGTQSGLVVIELNKHENDKKIYNSFKMQGVPAIWHMSGDERNNDSTVWIATDNGLFLYRNEGKRNRILKHFPKQGSPRIHYLVQNSEEILLASEDGIYNFTIQKGYYKLYSYNALTLLLDVKGKLWAYGNNNLTVFDYCDQTGEEKEKRKVLQEGWESTKITSNLVTELYSDRTGIVWIGTQNGLNKYNPNRKQFAHYRNTGKDGSLSSNSIRTIFEDSYNNLWIGTNGGGLNFLPSQSYNQMDFNNFLHYRVNPTGPDHDAYCIEQVIFGKDTIFLIGTSLPEAIAFYRLKNGIPVKTKPPFSTSAFKSSIFDIEDDDKYIWFASIFNGLYRYEKHSSRIDHYHQNDGHSVSSNIIRDVMLDSKANLWIATGEGLSFLPQEEKNAASPVFGAFHFIPGDTCSIAHHYVLTLFEDSKGNIWVGTMGGGLNKYLGDGKFLTIDDNDGLPNKVIKGILEDEDGNLWISSNKGLSRLNPHTMEIINFDLNDGLQDYEFGDLACAKISNGNMIFGGARGLTVFKPEEIKRETTLPEVVFTELQILNQKVEVGQKVNGRVLLDLVVDKSDEIRLKYSENSFSFTFAGLHFSSPAKVEYKYMLEGFNEDWIKTKAPDNTAKYTSLPPGKYTLKIMASNNDGIWNPLPKTLNIKVLPPFWYSLPALIVYALVLFTVILFFKRYTFIRIREKHKLQMEQFEQDKINELAQMKLRFYTNISHEFRTPLTLIIGPVKLLMQKYNSLTPSRSKQLLQTVYRNSAMLLRLINQLMDIRKMEQNKMQLSASKGNFYLTAKEIYESFKEMAFQKRINYTFNSFSNDIELWYETEKIEKILYNLLSNAFKYTPKEGSVSFLIIETNEEYVEIRITDTGIGISEAVKDRVFERFYRAKTISDSEVGSTGIGLALTKGLVEIHKGEIGFNSAPGQGTTFYFRLRKGNSHLSNSEISREAPQVYSHINDIDLIDQEEINEESPCESSIEGNCGNLLIVEDNIELRRYIKDFFVKEFNVYTAEDGVNGWSMVLSCEPDIIISDLMMPRMDGLELCQRVKGDELTSHIPFILLTAKINEETQINSYNLGADAYVPKPFDIEVLQAQIRSILKRRKEIHKNFKESFNIKLEEVAMTAMDDKYLQKTCKLIEDNIVDPNYSVAQLSSDYGMSQKLMNKKLKALTGLTAKSFIRSIKMKRAAQLLKTGRYTVSEITYDVGFSDLKYFRSRFKDEFGITPSEYKKIHSDPDEGANDAK